MSDSYLEDILEIEIEPGLYLGCQDSIYNVAKNNITAVVSVVNAESENWSFPSIREWLPEHHHIFITCLDPSTIEVLNRLTDICNFIEEHHQNGRGNVLIHFMADALLSATIITAYLMRKKEQSLLMTLRSIQNYNIKLNKNLLRQLIIWKAANYKPILSYEKYLNARVFSKAVNQAIQNYFMNYLQDVHNGSNIEKEVLNSSEALDNNETLNRHKVFDSYEALLYSDEAFDSCEVLNSKEAFDS